MKNDERLFIAIDLGTTNLLAYVSGQGVVYNEKAAIAQNTLDGKILAYGNEAYEMVGKTNDNVAIIFPIKEGAISDFDETKNLISYIFSKLNYKNAIKGSIMLLACPSGITEIERDALKQMGIDFGASYVVIENESRMASLGAGMEWDTARGQIIVDLGAGTTSIAIMSRGECIFSDSIKQAGRYFQEELMKYIKSEYNVLTGIITCERIIEEIGTMQKPKTDRTTVVFGRDVISGLPKEVLISSSEVLNVLVSAFLPITDAIIKILEQTPPELAGDIIKNGIVLTGGGALIPGVETYFVDIFSIPCRKSKTPLEDVIRGAALYEPKLRAMIEDKTLAISRK